MSQQQVGQVYSKIIDQVCDASQVDFEEGGVDSDTLKLLKQRWQKKLSALEVGDFPWEPQPQSSAKSVKPSPTPPPPPPSSKASNATKLSQSVVSESGRPSPAPPSNQGSRVKAEPAPYQPTDSPAIGYPNAQMSPLPPGTPQNYVAQQRAAQALQRQYGPMAAVQVNQLRQSSGQHQQSGLPSLEDQDSEDRKPIMPDFVPPVPPSRTSLQSAQQDGADASLADWKAEVARRRATPVQPPVQGERLFRDYMLHRQQQIEGGGLMVPLNERYISTAGTKRRMEALSEMNEEQRPTANQQPMPSSLICFQADAQADEDEDDSKDIDEDAINSDLDDPEDVGGDPEDETVEQVMLCTYDKVQRTKNKWKCYLKDGILRVGNKEYVMCYYGDSHSELTCARYVFNKGQGEFEW